MTITIQAIDENNAHLFNRFDNTFEAQARLSLTVQNGKISYSIEEIPPFIKRYKEEDCDSLSYIGKSGKTIFFAFLDGQPAGQIRLNTHWNRLAYIEDIVVDSTCRRRGLAKALLQHAIQWAKEKHFAGLMLETQDINVGACLLYEKCGFVLGGFDRLLYMGLPEVAGETALFWYHPLKERDL